MKIFTGERRRWCASFMAAAFAHMAITLYLAGHAVEVEPAGLPFEYQIGIELESYASAEASHEPLSRPKMMKAAAPPKEQAAKKDQVVEQLELEESDRTEPGAAEEPAEKPVEKTLQAATDSLVAIEAKPTQEAPKAATSPEPFSEVREGAKVAENGPGPQPQAAASRRGIEGFEAKLLAHLEKNKRYPREARLRRQEGVVYVRFAMSRHGSVISLKIEKSSGVSHLDNECLALVKRSEPLPALPAEIHGEKLEMVVPVYFSLR